MCIGAVTVRIVAVNFVGDPIEEGALAQREDHLPPMNRSAVAGKGDALVEHRVFASPGQDEPKSALWRTAEHDASVALLDDRAAILGERHAGAVLGGKDAPQCLAVLRE